MTQLNSARGKDEVLTKSSDREDRMCPKCGCYMRRQFPTTARPASKDGSWGFDK